MFSFGFKSVHSMRRYVDVSKDRARRNNPIFYRPLAQHEKLPKYLRGNHSETLDTSSIYSYQTFHFQGDYVPNHARALLPQSIEHCTPVSELSSGQQQSSLPFKIKRPQRQYIDGHKICRCGSTTHKNTLHK